MNPELSQAHLYPTMEDNVLDVEREKQKHLPGGIYGNESVMYECPNGHPYFISDCGKAWVTSTCPCGERIGGSDHNLTQRNRRGEQAQLSEFGHILGRPEDRKQIAEGQRSLSPLNCAVLRCITHLSLILSALCNPLKKVQNMIHQAPPKESILIEFLLGHIRKDLEHLADCCERSVDDCYIVLHEVLSAMEDAAGDREPVSECVLKTIAKRDQWEKQFDDQCMEPVLSKFGELINIIKGKRSEDTEKKLEALLFSREPLNDRTNVLFSSFLWRFKRPITRAMIRGKLDQGEFHTLKVIVRNCEDLKAIDALPDALELNKLLSQQFYCKFSRKQAKEMTMEEFCKQHSDRQGMGIREKVERVIEAAHSIAEESVSRNITEGDKLRSLSFQSPLAEYLSDQWTIRPGEQPPGSAPYTLIALLVNRHNDILYEVDNCYERDSDSRDKRSLLEMIPDHLTSIKDWGEICSIILSHGEYAIDGTSQVEYNWEAMEQEVRLKYIKNKPIILVEKGHVPNYMYSDDFTLLNKMQAIGQGQERLDMETHEAILNLLPGSVQALTDLLKEIEVIFNFLAASITETQRPDRQLIPYMQSIYGDTKKFGYLFQEVQLKHVKHVWFIIRFSQAGCFVNQNQEPFDDIDPDFRVGLTLEIEMMLKDCCSYQSHGTKVLLQELIEFVMITLNRATAANVYDRKFERDAKLSQALVSFIEQQHHEDYQRMEQIKGDLPKLPDKLLVKHAARAWSYIWRCFTTQSMR